MGALAPLADAVRACTACDRARTRRTPVPGAGGTDGGLLLVAAAPGLAEDVAGEALVGSDGAVLHELLRAAGIDPEGVRVAHLVRCRGSLGADPTPFELETCAPHLEAEIDAVAPRVICPLGSLATAVICGREGGIGREHGRTRRTTFAGHDVYAVPLHHPAAARTSARLRAELAADLERVAALLGVGRDLSPTDAAPGIAPVPVPVSEREAEGVGQLGLF